VVNDLTGLAEGRGQEGITALAALASRTFEPGLLSLGAPTQVANGHRSIQTGTKFGEMANIDAVRSHLILSPGTTLVVSFAISGQWPAMSFLALATLAIYGILGHNRTTIDLPTKAEFLEKQLYPPLESLAETMCIICRESPPNKPVLVGPCGHIFCKDCLNAWFEHTQCTCPLCTQPLFTLSDASAERRAKLLTALSSITLIAGLIVLWTTWGDYKDARSDGGCTTARLVALMATWLPNLCVIVLGYVVTVREEWKLTTEDWWARVDGHHLRFVRSGLQQRVLTGLMMTMSAWLVALGWCWSVGELPMYSAGPLLTPNR